MSQLALNVNINNAAKEYAVRQTQQQTQKPQEEGVKLAQGMRESGFQWVSNDKSELSLTDRISGAEALLTTSTSDTSAKMSRSGSLVQDVATDLKRKFKKMFVSSYSNVFSHNRLMAKVSEWMVGNVMERLSLMGITPGELDSLKGEVRSDLIAQNHTAMEQVCYDKTMLEIIA